MIIIIIIIIIIIADTDRMFPQCQRLCMYQLTCLILLAGPIRSPILQMRKLRQ